MGRYVARRVVQLAPTLLAVSFLIFLMVRLIPGDPALLIAGENATPELVASIRERLGLDRPLLVQYATYLGHLLRGDLGTSLRTHRPVAEEIAVRLPATLQLAVAAGLIFTVLGVLLGVAAGIRRGRWRTTWSGSCRWSASRPRDSGSASC